MSRVPLALALLIPVVGIAVNQEAVGAATVRPVAFSEMVDQAALIVRGHVVATRSFRAAPAAPLGGARIAAGTQAPALQPAGARATAAAGAPVSLPTENTGRMIFTQVDLQVAEYVKGGGGSIVQFFVAGGTVDGVRAWVPGLPSFAAGDEVLLFFRQGFDRAADPAVGVSQGVFRIERDPSTGAETLLNADGHFVIGVESDRVIARRNPRAALASADLVPTMLEAPVPSTAGVAAASSREAARFYTSTEPPMAVGDFLSAVTARLR